MAAGTARNVSGGDGNDEIYVGAPNIENISGGRGDDVITIWNPNGNTATLTLNEGDGHDVVKAYGPLRIERFNADGSAQALDLASLSVTRGEDGEFIIDFGNGTDSLTVYRQATYEEIMGRETVTLQMGEDGTLLL